MYSRSCLSANFVPVNLKDCTIEDGANENSTTQDSDNKDSQSQPLGVETDHHRNDLGNQNINCQTPLRTHVKIAVHQYLDELQGQLPTNLYDTFLQEVEQPLIEVVLEQTHGNQSKACLILGINRGTLRKKMQLYGLL